MFSIFLFARVRHAGRTWAPCWSAAGSSRENQCVEEAVGGIQAYPFIVRKVLRDAGPSSSLLLRDLVLDAGGGVRPARLSALLNAALGRVAARADGFVDFDAMPAESASVQARPAWARGCSL